MTLKRFELVVIAVAAVTCVLLATDAWPGLRGPESWRWERRVAVSPLPLLGVVVTFLATVVVSRRVRRADAAASAIRHTGLPALVALLVFAQMLLLTAAEPGGLSNLARRVKDASFTSYHTIARGVDDPIAFLRDYPRLQSRFPVHGPSQPPGRVLFFWAVNRAAGDPDRGALAAALLLLAAGALCVVPLAILAGGRGDPQATGAALLLFSSVPSVLLFTPQTDHLILLFTMSAAALLFKSVRTFSTRGATIAAGAAGLFAGVALFVSLTSAAALGAWGLAIAGHIALTSADDRPPVLRLLALAAAALAGLLLALAVPAVLGMNWPAVVGECVAGAHRIQVLVFRRTFAEWALRNLLDFALFLGPPLAFAAIGRAAAEARAAVRRAASSSTSTSSPSPASPPFALALLIALFLLDFSGKILGETGRIWMFLMPLAVLAVAAGPTGRSSRGFLILAASQCAVLLALRLFLNVPG